MSECIPCMECFAFLDYSGHFYWCSQANSSSNYVELPEEENE